ncbi:hypothetical protein WICPIJ_005186 [Wickerhamomyces pijperi]|uniref:Uncharacterized protein n=1 Tax=Wickerhamomyces pijperi TaxID=599730 RepID=A0A9P8Q4H4_WICPI|nr:hypothetical protein WICPIJ_005186 [Wickerhamomyces pijperi]
MIKTGGSTTKFNDLIVDFFLDALDISSVRSCGLEDLDSLDLLEEDERGAGLEDLDLADLKIFAPNPNLCFLVSFPVAVAVAVAVVSPAGSLLLLHSGQVQAFSPLKISS